MNHYGIKNAKAELSAFGLNPNGNLYWNLSQAELVEKTLLLKQGVLSDTGALSINTGEFTGRAPKDKFIVKDAKTANTVHWGDVNVAFDESKFDALYKKVAAHLSSKDLFIKEAFACANPAYKLNVRVVSEFPWAGNVCRQYVHSTKR